MSEECLKNAQDLTKSQKHESITHSPTWIQEMLAHLKRQKDKKIKRQKDINIKTERQKKRRKDKKYE